MTFVKKATVWLTVVEVGSAAIVAASGADEATIVQLLLTFPDAESVT